jgi:RNA polymerase sigma-B factor
MEHSSGKGRAGDPAAERRARKLVDRDAMILRLLPVARRLARRYAGGPERLDDLEQIAIVGVIKAVARFDPDRGTPLVQFAVPFIHGELKHHLRDNLGLPRAPRAMQANAIKVTSTERTLSSRLGRPARAAEIAVRTGLTESEVLASQELAAAQRTSSLNAGSDTELGPSIDSLARDDDLLEAVEYRHSLNRILGSLDKRERMLLFLRLGVGRTHREAATELGMSPAQASRLFRQALGKARTIAAAIDRPASLENAPDLPAPPRAGGVGLSPGIT